MTEKSTFLKPSEQYLLFLGPRTASAEQYCLILSKLFIYFNFLVQMYVAIHTNEQHFLRSGFSEKIKNIPFHLGIFLFFRFFIIILREVLIGCSAKAIIAVFLSQV